MQIKLKKILAGLCCLVMMTSVCAVPAISEDADTAGAETTEDAAEEKDDEQHRKLYFQQFR